MKSLVRVAQIGLLLAGLVSTASAAPLTTQCGAVLRTTAKTSTDTFTFNSQAFVNVPNGLFSVNVPTGVQRCVTVTFSASTSCPLECFVRVLDGATEMEPSGVNNQLASGNSSEVHSFQWVRRIGAGAHAIKLQIGTGGTALNATIGPYTVNLEVSEAVGP